MARIMILYLQILTLLTPGQALDGGVSGSRALGRRAAPVVYPGAGGPCTNEFRYSNFDVLNSKDDRKHVQAIHDAFCLGFGPLVASGVAVAQDQDGTVFKRYFPDGDEAKTNVTGVLNLLVDTANNGTTPKPITADMIIDNNDFTGACKRNKEAVGYTDVDPNDGGREKTHLCKKAYDPETLPSDNKCRKLHDEPDKKMDSLARVLLHRMLMYGSVASNNGGVGNITNAVNNDGLGAYYPQRAHALVREKPSECQVNADSYAWLAANAYYKYVCTRQGETPKNNGNFEEPEPYKPGHPGDD